MIKRAIVFGGLGFIGASIVDRLVGAGAEVVVVDSLVSACVPLENYSGLPNLTVHAVSAEEYCSAPSDFAGTDVAIHAASAVGPAGILEMGGMLGNLMTRTTAEIIGACERHDVPLIYFSSAEVYGRSGELGEDDTLQTPSGYNVRVEYALAKTLGEAMVANSRNRALRAIAIRPFNVVGPRQLPNGGFVFPTFGDQAVAGRPLTVFADGVETRAFTSVDDIARFVCDFGLAALASPDFVFNIGNPNNAVSIRELAKLFVGRSGSSSAISMCDPKDIHGPLYELAHSIEKIPVLRAATSLGWQPTESLDHLVDECLRSSRALHA